ncbi:MAG TPA: serine/threonine-protein kinase, partial [Thermoanaerobaculia bacterium]
MALSPGRRLGPYEILSSTGAGGMGEVYRARDSRLGRDVAIKVLPQDVAADAERLRRFEREARAASALNHPNIVTVHDVGVSGSTSYIAMEMVEGKSLRDLLLPGPLPVKKLLDVAAQIADGLAAAHEAGIVHRDLKPRNVIVTKQGHVKIVDFGLAKVALPVPAAPGDSEGSTVGDPTTATGEVVGTVEYMSPEQARGKSIDYRSDQFSFGTILYEMATGKRAFARGTPADTLVAVLQQEPEPLERIRPELPAPFRWITERCLAKAPEDRYSSTRDLARDLWTLKDRLAEIGDVSRNEVRAGVSRGRRSIAIVLAVCGLALLAALPILVGFGRSPIEPNFRRLTFRRGLVSRALFAPVSNSILYSATWDGESPRTFAKLVGSTSLD